MSANRDQPHLLVLPEDDANRQIANGFLLQLDFDRQRRMQILPVAGGWRKVLDTFQLAHVTPMSRFPLRNLLLLLDFDGDSDRLGQAKNVISDPLKDRVFILGVWTKPEHLKQAGQGLEPIGEALAQDCRDGTEKMWSHNLLRHNAEELKRLNERVRGIFFQVETKSG